MKYSPWLSLFPVATIGCLIPLTAKAQVTPDGTTSTMVNQDGNNFIIEQGDRINDNLFHSFNEFSVPTLGSAVFNNAGDITNIFSRVTGSSVSSIDGLLSANGAANLFLINPNGIIFGQNARLDLGGSFFASTADSLLFEGDAEFSAVNPQALPLLEVSIPIGARFRDNPGDIVSQSSALDFISASVGLQVDVGKTLALIGGNILIEEGILSAPEGRIELGSLKGEGQISLTPSKTDFSVSYDAKQQFGNIDLSKSSSVESGSFLSFSNSGDINIQADKVTLDEGSQIISESFSSEEVGMISIQSSELNIDNSRIGGLGLGKVAKIDIQTERLTIQNQGQINTFNTIGESGNITINAQKFIKIMSQSSIFADTQGIGSSNVFINTSQLSLSDRSSIFAGNLGFGNGGNIEITATDSVKITNSFIDTSSIDTTQVSTSDQSSGQGGNISIKTNILTVQDTAQIASSVLTNGRGGNLDIVANKVILRQNSELSAAAPLGGTAGSLTLTTEYLNIADSSAITVSSPSGLAGNLNIKTDSLFQNQGQITAETRLSEADIGANINLEISDIWSIENGSQVSATAFGDANGGNININQGTSDTEFLLFAFPPTDSGGSDITANAEQGDGGRIDITAAGVFGIDFRDISPQEAQSNSLNDFSVSSQFGTSGETIINRTVEDPTSGLINLPEVVGDASDQISQNPCEQGVGSEFTITGKGGLPPNVNESLNSESAQVGLIETVLSPQQKVAANNISLDNSISEATPAMGWVFNDKGEVTLTAYSTSNNKIQRSGQQHHSTCKSGISH